VKEGQVRGFMIVKGNVVRRILGHELLNWELDRGMRWVVL
jgi:hypothetical protein